MQNITVSEVEFMLVNTSNASYVHCANEGLQCCVLQQIYVDKLFGKESFACLNLSYSFFRSRSQRPRSVMLIVLPLTRSA